MKQIIQLKSSLKFLPLKARARRPHSRRRANRSFASALCLLAGGLILVNPSAARAVSGTWLASASGNWSDSFNWAGDVIADGAGSICYGASLAPNGVVRTITVDAPRTIGGFSMNCNGTLRTYVIEGATITLEGATPPEVFALNGPVVMNAVLDGTAGARFSAQNSGGIPSIYLNAVNIYSGDTEISLDGSTKIGIVDAIPHGSGKGNVVLSDRNGNGHGYGTLDLLSNSITINGLSGTNGTVTASSAEPGTSELTVGDNDATATFGGVINDGLSGRQVALTKIGNGDQVLNGANGYTANTTVNGGTLVINGSIASSVTVLGGLLDGTGTIYGTVTVGAGGSVSGGSSPGILRVYGLDLSAGGTNIWDLVENSDSNPGTDFDQIDLQSATFDLTDSTLSIRLSGNVDTGDAFWNSSHTWTIVTSFGTTGSSNFKTIEVLGGTPPGDFSTANDGQYVTVTFTPGVVPFKPPVPRVTSVVKTGPTSVTVNYTNTVAGTNYVVQYRTNLNTTNWSSLAPVTAAGTTSSSADAPPVGSPHRYYRVYGQF